MWHIIATIAILRSTKYRPHRYRILRPEAGVSENPVRLDRAGQAFILNIIHLRLQVERVSCHHSVASRRSMGQLCSKSRRLGCQAGRYFVLMVQRKPCEKSPH
jgi:hypothetical protein